MDLAEFTVFSNEVGSTRLNLLDVIFNFDGVVPSHTCTIAVVLALRVLNDELESLKLFKHHRFLAVDHLSSHRVVKVGDLLEGDTFFIELLGVLSHIEYWLRDLESMFTEDTSVLDECHELLTVVYFE